MLLWRSGRGVRSGRNLKKKGNLPRRSNVLEDVPKPATLVRQSNLMFYFMKLL